MALKILVLIDGVKLFTIKVAKCVKYRRMTLKENAEHYLFNMQDVVLNYFSGFLVSPLQFNTAINF
jgi:hypothetical protein